VGKREVQKAQRERIAHIERHPAGATLCFVVSLIDQLPADERRSVVDALDALYPTKFDLSLAKLSAD